MKCSRLDRARFLSFGIRATATFCIASLFSAAYANDGFGELGIGGIAIEKTNDIALQKEVLEIGYKRIKVEYEFLNESERDIVTPVSFPLPKYPAFPSQSGVISKGEPPHFEVTAQGKPVLFETLVQAIFKGQQITRELKALGLTERQIAAMPFALGENLGTDNIWKGIITQGQETQLKKMGLLENELPRWEIQVTYRWEQLFPAKSTVKISHQYQPFVAEGTLSGYPPGSFPEHPFVKRFCIDPKIGRTMENLAANKNRQDPYGMLAGTIVDYILMTANTWKDGIRDFTLRLRKESPAEVISLCFPAEFMRVDARTLESHLTHFSPKTDLSIYFSNIGTSGPQGGNYGVVPSGAQ